MPETTNTAEMAKKVSREIFSEFGWEQKGPDDENWECVSQEKHALNTHPSDVVFWYPDPYHDAKVFLNVDLKSYAVGSLRKAQVRDALTRLSKATDCANISTGWRNLYGDDNSNYRCHGLLFVYNHDGHYTGDFEKFFEAMDTKDTPLEGPNRVFVFSPATVAYLSNIAIDMQRARGTRKLPAKGSYSFFYPDFIGPHPKRQNQSAASIEVLLSPWQIIRFVTVAVPGHEYTAEVPHQVQYFVYYRGNGASVNEFKYLFDAFFRYDLLGDDGRVSLRMPYAHTEAAAFFDRAKDAYTDDFHGLKEFRMRLNRITFDPIDALQRVFSSIAIGMEPRNRTTSS